MMRIVKTHDKSKLMELSLKQREMLMAYRRDIAERERHLDERVTWREVVAESRVKNKAG